MAGSPRSLAITGAKKCPCRKPVKEKRICAVFGGILRFRRHIQDSFAAVDKWTEILCSPESIDGIRRGLLGMVDRDAAKDGGVLPEVVIFSRSSENDHHLQFFDINRLCDTTNIFVFLLIGFLKTLKIGRRTINFSLSPPPYSHLDIFIIEERIC